MARDGNVNIVVKLEERGFDPPGSPAMPGRPGARCIEVPTGARHHTQRVKSHGARVPEQSALYAHANPGRARHDERPLYAETPEWLITRLNRVPIQPASFASPHSAGAVDDPGLIAGDQQAVIASAGLPAESEVVDEANVPPGSDGSALIRRANLSSGEVTVLSAEVPGDWLLSQAPELARVSQAERGAATLEHMLTSRARIRRVQPFLRRPKRLGELSVPTSSEFCRSSRARRGCFGRRTARYCAQVPVGDRLEIYGLSSAGFRDWLIDGYLTQQNQAPSSWAVRRLIATLEARARFARAFLKCSCASARTAEAARANSATSSIWVTPAAGRWRFGTWGGASSIGRACTSAVPRGCWPCRRPSAMDRSTLAQVCEAHGA